MKDLAALMPDKAGSVAEKITEVFGVKPVLKPQNEDKPRVKRTPKELFTLFEYMRMIDLVSENSVITTAFIHYANALYSIAELEKRSMQSASSRVTWLTHQDESAFRLFTAMGNQIERYESAGSEEDKADAAAKVKEASEYWLRRVLRLQRTAPRYPVTCGAVTLELSVQPFQAPPPIGIEDKEGQYDDA